MTKKKSNPHPSSGMVARIQFSRPSSETEFPSGARIHLPAQMGRYEIISSLNQNKYLIDMTAAVLRLAENGQLVVIFPDGEKNLIVLE